MSFIGVTVRRVQVFVRTSCVDDNRKQIGFLRIVSDVIYFVCFFVRLQFIYFFSVGVRGRGVLLCSMRWVGRWQSRVVLGSLFCVVFVVGLKKGVYMLYLVRIFFFLCERRVCLSCLFQVFINFREYIQDVWQFFFVLLFWVCMKWEESAVLFVFYSFFILVRQFDKYIFRKVTFKNFVIVD